MSLLRDRRLAALLVAEMISSTGTQMTWLALPWFVLRETGSPQRMTWVIIAEILPVATELEHRDEYPTEIVEGLKDLGLFGLMIPEEYDGLGESLLT